MQVSLKDEDPLLYKVSILEQVNLYVKFGIETQ